jgi:hypothetical protein
MGKLYSTLGARAKLTVLFTSEFNASVVTAGDWEYRKRYPGSVGGAGTVTPRAPPRTWSN